MRRWAGRRTVENRGVVVRVSFVEFQVATFEALIFTESTTTAAFRMAWEAFAGFLVYEVIDRALVLALFSPFVAGAFLADLLVESILGTLLAARVALAADRLSGQLLEGAFVLFDTLTVVSVWTGFILHQTAFHGSVATHDCPIAGDTSIRGDRIPWSITADTGRVAGNASSIQIVLGEGTLRHAEFSILDVDARSTVVGIWSVARIQTLWVAVSASLAVDLVNLW